MTFHNFLPFVVPNVNSDGPTNGLSIGQSWTQECWLGLGGLSPQSELLGQFSLIVDRASDVSGGRICLTQNAYAKI